MNSLVDTQTNVLLVDDRPENLIALEALLSSDIANYIKCHSGEEALKFLMKEECALILLDVQMRWTRDSLSENRYYGIAAVSS